MACSDILARKLPLRRCICRRADSTPILQSWRCHPRGWPSPREKAPPDRVFAQIFPALYRSVYTLKFDLKRRGLESFKVGASRARYPNAHLHPKQEWLIIAGIPVPDDTRSLPQKEPGTEVRLETWEYGTVAQVLHLGPYDQETQTIKRLHEFVAANGYEIVGPHEEEYLSRPDAEVTRTLIRYQVKKTS